MPGGDLMKTKMSSPNIGSRYKIFRTINNECYLFDMDHSLKNVFFPLLHRYRWHPAYKISENDAETLENAAVSSFLSMYIYIILSIIPIIDLCYLFFNYGNFEFKPVTMTSLFIYSAGVIVVLYLRIRMIKRIPPMVKDIIGKTSTENSQIKIRAEFGREFHMVFAMITARIVLILLSLLPVFFQDTFLIIFSSPFMILGSTFLNQLYAEKTDFNLFEK